MSKSLNAGMTGREFSLSELRAAHRHVGTRGGDRPASPRRQVRHGLINATPSMRRVTLSDQACSAPAPIGRAGDPDSRELLHIGAHHARDATTCRSQSVESIKTRPYLGVANMGGQSRSAHGRESELAESGHEPESVHPEGQSGDLIFSEAIGPRRRRDCSDTLRSNSKEAPLFEWPQDSPVLIRGGRTEHAIENGARLRLSKLKHFAKTTGRLITGDCSVNAPGSLQQRRQRDPAVRTTSHYTRKERLGPKGRHEGVAKTSLPSARALAKMFESKQRTVFPARQAPFFKHARFSPDLEVSPDTRRPIVLTPRGHAQQLA